MYLAFEGAFGCLLMPFPNGGFYMGSCYSPDGLPDVRRIHILWVCWKCSFVLRNSWEEFDYITSRFWGDLEAGLHLLWGCWFQGVLFVAQENQNSPWMASGAHTLQKQRRAHLGPPKTASERGWHRHRPVAVATTGSLYVILFFDKDTWS